MKLSYRPGFSLQQQLFMQAKRNYREEMGGSRELQREAIISIMSGINQDKNQNLKNPEDILDKQNIRELEVNLQGALAKPWWDLGASEDQGKLQPTDDEGLIKQSRTSDLNFQNRLSPNPALEAQQQTAADVRSIKNKNKMNILKKKKLLNKYTL